MYKKPPQTRWGTLCALLLLLVLSVWLRWGWPGPKPTELHLSGNAEQLGREFAAAKPRRLAALEKQYLRDVICGQSEETYQRYTAMAKKWLPLLHPAHRLEFDAFADEADLPVETLMLANSFLDLGLYRTGCRALVCQGIDGFFHAHNLDWDGMNGLASWVICVVRRAPDDGRYRTVALSMVGILGAFDIINEHGIALSINQVSVGTSAPVEPTFLRIRRIAETCSTFREAKEELEEGFADIPFTIILSSAKEREAAVFEGGRGRFTVRRMQVGLLGADNAQHGEKWGKAPIEQLAEKKACASIDDVKRIMRHRDIMLDNNIYSVIFDYHRNRMLLASGRIPAARHRHREFVLFRDRHGP